MRIIYLNDTSTYGSTHLGCYAVQQYHDKNLLEHHEIVKRYSVTEMLTANTRDFLKELENADAVVANGEGTIHHQRGMKITEFLALAKAHGKKAYLINALLQEIHKNQADILSICDDVVVRDKLSYDYAVSLNIPCRLEFDSCVGAEWEKEPIHTELKGKLVVTDCHPAVSQSVAITNYAETNLHAVKYSIDNVSNAGSLYKYAAADLSQADLVITGRHHAMYMCALSGTPFVLLESNSWKIKGFVEMVGENIPIVSSPADLDSAMEYALSRKNMYKRIQRLLLERPLKTFDVINED